MVHIYVHQTSIFFNNIVREFLHMICGLMLFSNYLLKRFSLFFTMNTSNAHICIYIFYHVTNHSLYDLCANKSQSDPFAKFSIWKCDQLHCLSSTIFAVYIFFCFVFGSKFVTLHLFSMIDSISKLTLFFFKFNFIHLLRFVILFNVHYFQHLKFYSIFGSIITWNWKKAWNFK